MVLSPYVLMTENIRQRQTEVFEAIQNGRACDYVYCITMPSYEKNLLDIHPYREIYKRKEYDRPFVILGLSENRSGAVNIVTEMAAEVAASMEKPEDFRENFIRFRDSLLEEQEQVISMPDSEDESGSCGKE